MMHKVHTQKHMHDKARFYTTCEQSMTTTAQAFQSGGFKTLVKAVYACLLYAPGSGEAKSRFAAVSCSMLCMDADQDPTVFYSRDCWHALLLVLWSAPLMLYWIHPRGEWPVIQLNATHTPRKLLGSCLGFLASYNTTIVATLARMRRSTSLTMHQQRLLKQLQHLLTL